MTSTRNSIFTVMLTLGALALGCSHEDSLEDSKLSVFGLTESRNVVACSELVLDAASNTASDASTSWTWNVTAPTNASFSSVPTEHELRFLARTAGVYSFSVTQCRTSVDAAEECTSTEFGVTVVAGSDNNGNGIGDACEASTCIPACDGRSCGLDPICNQSCGSCGSGQACNESSGQCEAACVPACEGRTCGLDPICGQSCGTCGAGQTCDEEAGQCKAACVPACDGRSCGLDPVCNTSCGTCGEGTTCNSSGQCEDTSVPGKVVTIVMALTDRRLSFTDPFFNQRARLIEQSVRWASPVEAPKVLVVLDDVTSDWTREAQLIRSSLRRSGISVTQIQEPSKGLQPSQLQEYDVVWFSNPALPVDDARTISTLTSFVHEGGGLILQGDDISQPKELEPLTRLRNVSTGKQYCGRTIDDDRGASYLVRIERQLHPVTASLLGNNYYYGDDIDTSTFMPTEGAMVLSWAQVGSCQRNSGKTTACPKQPVIVAYDMAQ